MAKGTSLLCEPSGYVGRLPGQTTLDTGDLESCARARPLNRLVFRKRKLMQMHNLHTAADRAAKPSNIRYTSFQYSFSRVEIFSIVCHFIQIKLCDLLIHIRTLFKYKIIYCIRIK